MGYKWEDLILKQIQTFLVGKNSLSENQFGFRKGRSTVNDIQAIDNIPTNARKGSGKRKGFRAFISIDIRNAFYTARWNICIEAMMRKKIPDYLLRMIDDDLSDRWVICEGDKWSQRRDAMWRTSRVAGRSTRLERHLWRFPAHCPACWNENHRLRRWRICRVWRGWHQNPGAEDQWMSVVGKERKNTWRSQLPKPSNVEQTWLGFSPTLVDPGKKKETGGERVAFKAALCSSSLG